MTRSLSGGATPATYINLARMLLSSIPDIAVSTPNHAGNVFCISALRLTVSEAAFNSFVAI
jgi:hypothetical protein